jgi:AcrR family transcriptional regulator
MTQQELRERILSATVALLNEYGDADKITVRQIAERAGVGIGSINYTFDSKDNLLNEAIWQIVGGIAARWYAPVQPDVPPLTRLRRLFKEGGQAAFRYRKLTAKGMLHVIAQGNMQVQTLILPLLREVVGERKSETELRLLAYQLVVSLQAALVNAEQLGAFLGVDMTVPATLDLLVDGLIDNLIGDQTKGEK